MGKHESLDPLDAAELAAKFLATDGVRCLSQEQVLWLRPTLEELTCELGHRGLV